MHYLTHMVLCKVLSYLLACTSRMSYWLMGMVAIERVYVTWYMQGTWLKSPRIAKRIIASVIIGIMVADIHELGYYQSIEDPKSLDANNSRWCVTSYPFGIATYNQVNIILNYILPFLINFVSTIILITLITRKRAIATTKQSAQGKSQSKIKRTIRTYFDLLTEKKDLILAPSITMLPQLFSLPQFILSFSLACQEFKVDWQRYLLIISYFVTYLPQVLFYKLYVSPSSFYTDEFHATNLYKKVTKWRAVINRRRV